MFQQLHYDVRPLEALTRTPQWFTDRSGLEQKVY